MTTKRVIAKKKPTSRSRKPRDYHVYRHLLHSDENLTKHSDAIFRRMVELKEKIEKYTEEYNKLAEEYEKVRLRHISEDYRISHDLKRPSVAYMKKYRK